MTQKYYCERLLPYYIDGVSQARLNKAASWVLQEDNDPSHSTSTHGLATQLKTSCCVDSLQRPLQSPDLNPKEGVWNILKRRVRRRSYDSIPELRTVLQEE